MKHISDFVEYHKNPRKITEERSDRLQESLERLGDLGGIVLDIKTNQVIGGNQRVKTFLRERDKFLIEIVENFGSPRDDGTVAYGYVVKNKGTDTEQKFSYREVDWDEKTCEEANIVANKLTGSWDMNILANQFDLGNLVDYGFSRSELDLFPKENKVELDETTLNEDLATYLQGNIKQIVLYFKNEQFDSVCRLLDYVMEFYGVENHTEAFLKVLEYWQNENSKS